MVTRAVRAFEGSKPGRTCCRLMKLRVKSAAPMSSMSDSATSVMTRTRRVLDTDTAARVKRKRAAYAAATPKPSAAISASRPATDSTRQPNPTSSAPGSELGLRRGRRAPTSPAAFRQFADGHKVLDAVVAHVRRLEHERSPHVRASAELEWRGELGAPGERETGRHHPGERKGSVAEVDALSDDIATTAELALPQVVADQRDVWPTRHRLCTRECAANHWRNAQHVEQRRGHACAGNRLSLGVRGLGDRIGPRPEGCHRIEAARVTLDVRVGAAAQRQLAHIAIVPAPGKPNDVDALRIPVWERS